MKNFQPIQTSLSSSAAGSGCGIKMPRPPVSKYNKMESGKILFQNGVYKMRKLHKVGSSEAQRVTEVESKGGFEVEVVECKQEPLADSCDEMKKREAAFTHISELHESGPEMTDSLFDEELEDLGGNRDVGGEQSSSDEGNHNAADSGIGMVTPNVARGKVVITDTVPARSSEDRNDGSKKAVDKISARSRELATAYVVSKNGNGRPSKPASKPAFKTYISAAEGQKCAKAKESEDARRAIQQKALKRTAKLADLPRPPHIHLDRESYVPPKDFVPGSKVAAQWIARMKYKYTWKRESFIKCQQELLDILDTCPRRQAGGRITTSPHAKEIRWMQDHCKRMRADINAFDRSFPHYLSAHEKATLEAQRRADDQANHMAFCLSILQSHYEKHTIGSSDNIIFWNDGFRFCAESPWDHPEIPDRLNEEFVVDNDQLNSPVDDLLMDELGSLMSNMVIGV